MPVHRRLPLRQGTMAFFVALVAAVSAFSAQPPLRVLDFWGVGGFATSSRTIANTLLQDSAASRGFELEDSKDTAVFTPENLARFQVVILNNTTSAGILLSLPQRAALMEFAKTGGLVGINKATETQGTWPDLTTYLGADVAYYSNGIGLLRLDTTAGFAENHPITQGLPRSLRVDERWLNFNKRPPPESGFRSLYVLDSLACTNCGNCLPNALHQPQVWVREISTGGRLFYISMGHTDRIFSQVEFTKELLLRGILWAGNRPPVPVSLQADLSGRVRTALRPRFIGEILEVFSEAASGIEVVAVDGRILATGRSAQGHPARFVGLPRRSLALIRPRAPDGPPARLVFLP